MSEGVYLDAVVDENLKPVFNGTPEKTKQWLRDNPEYHVGYEVCLGKTMRIVSVQGYLAEDTSTLLEKARSKISDLPPATQKPLKNDYTMWYYGQGLPTAWCEEDRSRGTDR